VESIELTDEDELAAGAQLAVPNAVTTARAPNNDVKFFFLILFSFLLIDYWEWATRKSIPAHSILPILVVHRLKCNA
jgi:hypothetical protein